MGRREIQDIAPNIYGKYIEHALGLKGEMEIHLGSCYQEYVPQINVNYRWFPQENFHLPSNQGKNIHPNTCFSFNERKVCLELKNAKKYVWLSFQIRMFGVLSLCPYICQ